MNIRFNKQVFIEADSASVWGAMSEVERWHEWTPTIKSIKMLNGKDFKEGTKLQIIQPKLPDAKWEVFAIKKESNFFMKKGNAFLRVIAGHELEPAKAGTLVNLSIEFSGPFASWVVKKYGQMMEEYLAIETQGLKKECENVFKIVPTGAN